MSSYEQKEYASQEFADYLCKHMLNQEEQIKKLQKDISNLMDMTKYFTLESNNREIIAVERFIEDLKKLREGFELDDAAA